MQITSLTGFSSKRAHVYRIKVSFLLEIRTGVGSTWREGLRGRGGASKPLSTLFGGSGGGTWGSGHEHRLCLPQTWVAVQGPPCVRGQGLPAAHFLQRRHSPCC